MPSLEDLVIPEDEETIAQRMLDLSEAQDLPVTSWHDGSVWRVLHSVVAALVSDAYYAVAQIANGLVLGLSTGSWLNLLAISQFDDARKTIQFTEGYVTLTDNGGGPHTINLSAVVVADDLEHEYRNSIDDGLYPRTLPLNGSVQVPVKATVGGSAYNAANGTIRNMSTVFSTVTVDNPVYADGTWITQLGADIESDPELRARLPLKWATLATGSPPAAYKSWALAYTGVTRARVDDGNPDGPNTVAIYIDSSSAVAGLQTVVDGKKPSGTAVTVYTATSQTVTIPAIITVDAAYRAQAEIDANANLERYALDTDIGGIVREAEIIEQIMRVAGVIDVEIGSSWAGSPNIQLTTTAIPTFAYSLTWVEV